MEEHLEAPMFILAILWLYLFIADVTYGISKTKEYILYTIWSLFIFEFLLKLFLAPRKKMFIKENWLTLVALVIPALRVFRVFAALRVLRSVRIVNSTRIIRALTSGKRFFSALNEAQGPQPEPEMNVGFWIAIGNPENKEAFTSYAEKLANDVKNELEISTGLKWFFEIADITELKNDEPRIPSDFLDKASLRKIEGPYDLVCVLTDVSLISRRNRMAAGLVSSVARIMVLSVRKLMSTGRKQKTLSLNDDAVRFNSARIFLQLIGLLLGLKRTGSASSEIMKTDEPDNSLQRVPSFDNKEREKLKKNAKSAPERELIDGSFIESFVFHLLMTLRHPKEFILPLLKNRALLLPLSLPGLATAAVAPSVILIFTAEIWDVGLGMTNLTAAFFAVVSIMFGSFYLVRVQSLFLPRKDKRVLTEHLAVTNSVIYFSIFLACVGLFFMVGGIMIIIELYVFPPDLMQTWPTLNISEIQWDDKIRLAVFISTIGVTTGALAGGLESKKIIQHLALFSKSEA